MMSASSLRSYLLTGLISLTTGAELLRRQDNQAFTPITEPFIGTCADRGKLVCFMEGQTENCYDPTRGDSCCSNTWACPSGNFCLIENVCCPDGLDPATCAVDNGVSLPADFSIDNNNEDDVETLDDFEGVADNAIDVLNDDIDVDDRDEIDEDEEIQPPDFIGIIPADAEITPGSDVETIIDVAGIDPSATPSSEEDADSAESTPVTFEGAANAIAFSTSGLVLCFLCFAGILF